MSFPATIPGTEAARLCPDGRWRFSLEVPGGVAPLAACETCAGHDTAEEAYSHQYAHVIATAKFMARIEPTRCRVPTCIHHTSRAALAGDRLYPLCPAHHDVRSLAGLVRVTPTGS